MTPRDIGFHDGLDGLPPACNASHREDRRSETNNIFAVEYLAGRANISLPAQDKTAIGVASPGDSSSDQKKLFYKIKFNK